MSEEFDDTSLDTVDIAPIEDNVLDADTDNSFDIPETFPEDDLVTDDYGNFASEDAIEEPTDFIEDVDELNEIDDPDPYDVPEMFAEDVEDSSDEIQNNLVNDENFESSSEHTEEAPIEFDEDIGDNHENTDLNLYETPDSFDGDSEDTELSFSNDMENGVEDDFPEDTGAAYDTLPTESCDIPESFAEDTEVSYSDALNSTTDEQNIDIPEELSFEEMEMSELRQPECADEGADTSATTIDDLWRKVEEISNSDLSNEHKQELLNEIRNEIPLDAFDADDNSSSDGGPVKVLKRDEHDLLSSGNKNIDDILSVKEDDYRDKGYTDEEISTMLANDRIMLQEEFLRDAFPGQNISTHVFDGFNDATNTHDDAFHLELPARDYDNVLDNGEQQIDTSEYGEYVPITTDLNNLTDIPNWLGDINPNFDEFDIESPYSNNCGSCAYAVFQRLEGSSDACASAENIPYNSEMTALTGMEQVSMSPEEIKNRLLAEGNGAHAIIGIDRAEGCGHWFNAACIDGKVVAIDGQTGSISDWPPDYGDVVNWEMSIRKENINGHKTR